MFQLELPAVSPPGSLWDALEVVISTREMAVATRIQHRDHMRWLCEHFGPTLPVRAIGYPEVMGYVKACRERGLMNITIRKRLVTLKLALDDAYRRGFLERKPDWWPELRGDSRPNEVWWEYAEYRDWRLAFPSHWRICVDVYYHTAMHTSDLFRMRRSDVDLAKRRWLRRNTKSHATPAWLPMSEEFAALLDAWFVEAGIIGQAPVLPELPQQPSKAWRKVCEEHGISKRITPNRLRSSAVSRWFELGLDLETIAYFLGHRGDPMRSDIIRRHYLRFGSGPLDKARELLNRQSQ